MHCEMHMIQTAGTKITRRRILGAATLATAAATLASAPLADAALSPAIAQAASTSADRYSTEELNRRMIERRAVEAVIWGIPAVNYDLMLQEMLTKTPGKIGQVIYWATSRYTSAPIGPRRQLSTARGRRLQCRGQEAELSAVSERRAFGLRSAVV